MKQFTLFLALLCLPMVLFGVEPSAEANAVDCDLSYSIAIDTTQTKTAIEKTKTSKSPDQKKKSYFKWSKISKVSAFIALASFGICVVSQTPLLIGLIFILSIVLCLLGMIMTQILARDLVLTKEEKENERRAVRMVLLLIATIAALFIGFVLLS